MSLRMILQFLVAHRLAAPLLACIIALAAMTTRLTVERTRRDIGSDTQYYVAWGEQANERGVLHLYSVSDHESMARWQRHAMNYGPLFAYYVWVQTKVRHAVLGTQPYYHPFVLFALLVPMALCYIACGFILRTILEPQLGAARATAAELLYWLSPGIVMNSAYHGQTDALICLVMLISLWAAVSDRWALAAAVWTLGVLVKPQPVVIVPVLLAILFMARWRSWLVSGLAVTAVLLAVAGPFIVANTSVPDRFAWFTRTYQDSFFIWNQTTNNAYNLWWIDLTLTGNSDPAARLFGLPRSTWGFMLLGAAATDVLTSLYRRKQRRDFGVVAATAALISAAAFLFPNRVFGRYLIYGLVLIIPLAVINPTTCRLYLVLSGAWWVNLLFDLHSRAETAALPVPPVWLTGLVCAFIMMGGFVLLRLQLGRSGGERPPPVRRMSYLGAD
jgi:Dolichyl-phosphate-mannose-protein mannosyltransferase